MNKKINKLILVMLSLMLLVGCGKKGNVEVTKDEVKSENSGANVELLRVGTLATNDTFNATTQSGAYGRMNYNAFVQGMLFEEDSEGSLLPSVLESYEIVDDNKGIILTLPEELYWHDGVKVTANDLIFTFDYNAKNSEMGFFNSMTEKEKLNDRTVKVTFDETKSSYEFVARQVINAKIYPKHIWEKVEDPSNYSGEDAAIGCGPYKLVKIDENAQVSYYEAVDNYFKGDITVDKVEVRTYASQEALVAALKNDEIDAVYDYSNPMPSTLYMNLEKDENIDIGISPNRGMYMMMFGQNAKATDDLAFREAVSYALNYDLLGSTIYGKDFQTPNRSIIAPSTPGFYEGTKDLEYNIETAKKLFDEAGYVDTDGDGFREYKDGETMEILVTTQYSAKSKELYTRLATVIIDNLKDAGIRAVLDEESLVSQEAWSARSENGGTYQLYLGHATSGTARFLGAYSYILDAEYTGWWGTYKDPEFVQLYDTVAASKSMEEYVESMKEMQIYSERELPALALSWGKASFPYRTDKYEGWINYPSAGVINPETWYNLKTK